MSLIITHSFAKKITKLGNISVDDIIRELQKFRSGTGHFYHLFNEAGLQFYKGRLLGGKLRYVFAYMQIGEKYIPIILEKKESTAGYNIHKNSSDAILQDFETATVEIEQGKYREVEMV